MQTLTALSWHMSCDCISAGAKPQDVRRFRRNRIFRSAMHAAVQLPDLMPLMSEGAVDTDLSSLPGSKQVVVPSNTCVGAHCACRSGCCRLFLSECHALQQQSIPA